MIYEQRNVPLRTHKKKSQEKNISFKHASLDKLKLFLSNNTCVYMNIHIYIYMYIHLIYFLLEKARLS